MHPPIKLPNKRDVELSVGYPPIKKSSKCDVMLNSAYEIPLHRIGHRTNLKHDENSFSINE